FVGAGDYRELPAIEVMEQSAVKGPGASSLVLGEDRGCASRCHRNVPGGPLVEGNITARASRFRHLLSTHIGSADLRVVRIRAHDTEVLLRLLPFNDGPNPVGREIVNVAATFEAPLELASHICRTEAHLPELEPVRGDAKRMLSWRQRV